MCNGVALCCAVGEVIQSDHNWHLKGISVANRSIIGEGGKRRGRALDKDEVAFTADENQTKNQAETDKHFWLSSRTFQEEEEEEHISRKAKLQILKEESWKLNANIIESRTWK